jgi:hypothetical protein
MSHRVPIRRLIFRTLLFVAGVVLLTTPAPLLAQDDPALPAADPAVDAWPGEYIVVIDPAAGAVTAAQAHLAQAGELVEQATACGSTNVLQVWRLDDFAAAQQMLAGDPAVLAIEPNWIVRAASLPTPPPTTPETPFPFTDTYYASRQWNLQRSDAARAWQLIADHESGAGNRARGRDRQRRGFQPSRPGGATVERDQLHHAEQPAQRRFWARHARHRHHCGAGQQRQRHRRRHVARRNRPAEDARQHGQRLDCQL